MDMSKLNKLDKNTNIKEVNQTIINTKAMEENPRKYLVLLITINTTFKLNNLNTLSYLKKDTTAEFIDKTVK